MKKFITILLLALAFLSVTSCAHESEYTSFYLTTESKFVIEYNYELKSTYKLDSIPRTQKNTIRQSNYLSSDEAVSNEYATTRQLRNFSSIINGTTKLSMRSDFDALLTHLKIDSYIPTNEITKEENQAVNNPYILSLIKCAEHSLSENEVKNVAHKISYNSLPDEKKKSGEITPKIDYYVSYTKKDAKTTHMRFIIAQKLYAIKTPSRLNALGDEGFIDSYNTVLAEPRNNFEKVPPITSLRPSKSTDDTTICKALLKNEKDYTMSLLVGYSDEFSKGELDSVSLTIKSNKPFDEKMHDIATNSPYKKAIAAMFNMGYYDSNAEDIITHFKSKDASADTRETHYEIETESSYDDIRIYAQDMYSKKDDNYVYTFSVFLNM